MHPGVILHMKPEPSVPSTFESSARAGPPSPRGTSSQLASTSGQHSQRADSSVSRTECLGLGLSVENYPSAHVSRDVGNYLLYDLIS